jgi:hypothetical protein
MRVNRLETTGIKKDFFDHVVELSEPNSAKKKKKRRDSDTQLDGSLPPRPNLSYNDLIIAALCSSQDGQLSLQQIYDYIQSSFPYFLNSTVVCNTNQAWQNSIRHNLSVQKMFERVPRPSGNPGKGGLWRLVDWAANDEKLTRVGKSVAKGIVPPPSTNPFTLLAMNTKHIADGSTQPASPPRRRPTKKNNSIRQKKRKRNDSDCDSDLVGSTSFTAADQYPSDSEPFQESSLHSKRVDTQPVPYAPAAEGPDFMYDFTPKPNANLMDTLATLALEANVPIQQMNHSFAWENVSKNNSQQASIGVAKSTDWMAMLNSSNFIPFMYQQNPSKDEVSVPLLDPQVGDQTLLQATHACMDF